MMQVLFWTDGRIEELKGLWEQGNSYSDIGAAMGISRGAVSGKIDRLQLPPRQKGRSEFEIAESKRKKSERDAVNQRHRRTRLRIQQMQEAVASLPEFVGCLSIPFAELRDFSSIESNQCRFIASEPPGPDYPTCGNETLPGQSYCPHCMKITHRHGFELSETDKLKKRGHFIRIGNASKLGRNLDMGDAA